MSLYLEPQEREFIEATKTIIITKVKKVTTRNIIFLNIMNKFIKDIND